MATRSFLTRKEAELAQKRLRPFQVQRLKKPERYIDQQVLFFDWLSQELLEKLEAFPGWQESHPIALGSWARGELCPKSDVDLLFCGEEQVVACLVQAIQENGLQIRYRVPQNKQDWSEGVDHFDVLALYQALPLTETAAHQLREQQQRGSYKKLRQKLMASMRLERQDRNRRYDSITNYLEPNLKYGPGGLRDLQQALYTYELFEDRFLDKEVFFLLSTYRDFLLNLRCKLHLMGRGDVIGSHDQADLSEWLGFEGDIRSFMKELQVALSEVSFYADWVVEVARSSSKQYNEIKNLKWKSWNQAFKALEANQSLLTQQKIKHSKELKKHKLTAKQKGVWLNQLLQPKTKESFLVAVYRSGVLENLVPALKKVKGLVQHDQYHRFTVDAHTLQALRQVKRAYERPRVLGRLSAFVKNFSVQDWKVLYWSALYHDLAKGRKGDHSSLGAKLVEKDLAEMELPQYLKEEVSWMVKNHLLLSGSAFRRNPHDQSTWKFLHKRGVTGKRLFRLAVFTAVDILATNPEAWNEWKERLLFQLVEVMSSHKVTAYVKFLSVLKQLNIPSEFIKGMDPGLVESVPVRHLIEDFHWLRKNKGNLPVKVIQTRKGDVWVRFHRREDQAGLFLNYVQILFAMGCSIRESSAQTLAAFGVYDWFKVKTSKNLTQIRKMLHVVEVGGYQELAAPDVVFDQIDLVMSEGDQCIISFRGKDQKGVLIAATQALKDLNLHISWAKVHTWGRRLDDVFCVTGFKGEASELIKVLRQKFSIKELQNF